MTEIREGKLAYAFGAGVRESSFDFKGVQNAWEDSLLC